MHLRNTAAALIMLSVGGLAYAEAPSFYLGASFGQATLDDFDEAAFDDGSLTSADADDSDSSFRLFGGKQISENVAVEFGYVDLGEATFEGTSDGSGFWAPGPVSANASGEGFDLSILGFLPISKSLSGTARIGVLVWDSEFELEDSSGSLSGKDDGKDIFFGIGLQAALSQNFIIRGEFTKYSLDEDDIDALTASLVYRPGEN